MWNYLVGAFGPYEASRETWVSASIFFPRQTSPANVLNKLSQGLYFLRRVEQAESNEGQRDILVTGLANGTARPWNSISDYQMRIRLRMANSPLPYFSEAQIEAMVPAATRTDDTDKGPYTAWRLAYTGINDYQWVANREKETLRMIGYVFWDLDRIDRWDLEALCGWLKDESTSPDEVSTETTWHSTPSMPTTTWAKILQGRRWR
jgi:hypothetical protein